MIEIFDKKINFFITRSMVGIKPLPFEMANFFQKVIEIFLGIAQKTGS
jgi:hypothetical protein